MPDPFLTLSIAGALIQFGAQSEEKTSLWRAYELMESEAGNFKAAQNVYQRSIRDAIVKGNEFGDIDENKSLVSQNHNPDQNLSLVAMKSPFVHKIRLNTVIHLIQKAPDVDIVPERDDILKVSNEVEFSRWRGNSNSGFGEKREVWMNDGSIEGKVPASTMKKKSKKPKE